MSETSMVERARDAILAKVPYGYGMTPNEAASYARAVIEAIQEPTAAMCEAGEIPEREIALGNGTYARGLGLGANARTVWQRMVDAGLSPEAKTGEGHG